MIDGKRDRFYREGRRGPRTTVGAPLAHSSQDLLNLLLGFLDGLSMTGNRDDGVGACRILMRVGISDRGDARTTEKDICAVRGS